MLLGRIQRMVGMQEGDAVEYPDDGNIFIIIYTLCS